MSALIGFCGPMGAGKTFAAQRLARAGFECMRFAEPLKRMVLALGLERDDVDGSRKETPSAKLGGRTPRHAMQTLGTEWGRLCMGPEFWVEAWAGLADARLAVGRKIVVDDIRFANEVAAIRARGGLVIRVERPGLSGLAAPAAHASEGLDPGLCDLRLVNFGDESFGEQIEAAARSAAWLAA